MCWFRCSEAADTLDVSKAATADGDGVVLRANAAAFHHSKCLLMREGARTARGQHAVEVFGEKAGEGGALFAAAPEPRTQYPTAAAVLLLGGMAISGYRPIGYAMWITSQIAKIDSRHSS
jgi:hypothetical protein